MTRRPIRCSCGALLSAPTGEELLAAVERHAAEEHPDATWRGGPGLGDLQRQVVGLGRRIERLEQALEASWPG